MKCTAFVLVLLSFGLQLATSSAQTTVFTYQGRVLDSGTNFNGTGQFQFALVTSTNNNHTATATANLAAPFITSYNLTAGGNGYVTAPVVTITGGGGAGATATASLMGGVVNSLTPGSAGSGYTSTPTVTIAPPPANITYTTYWSNDGTSVAGSKPSAAVSVAVTNGLFTVVLGDPTQPNMAAINAALFNQPNLQLQIWFNDGANGFAALSPVQNLTPAPYAVFANTAGNLINGLTIQPNSDGAPNVIDGSSVNYVSSGVEGATIGGGGTTNYSGFAYTNRVTGSFGTVSGGLGNSVSGLGATVSGGENNTATTGLATVSGGMGNTASGGSATVSGGAANTASGTIATVSGGEDNTASSLDATVSGGFGNTAGGVGATVGGGLYGIAGGAGAFVGGGGYDGGTYSRNIASGNASVVAGGLGNQATNSYATVPGGANNTAGGSYATVGGGNGNTATGGSATVSGGSFNVVSGPNATVGGGANNKASGEYSFAAGQQAQALHQGAFVWADSQNATLSSTANNQFIARASGGFYFYTANGIVGAQLDANATSWSTISDRNAKKNFKPVNTVAVLDKLAAVPIEQWNYKWEQDSDVPNLGPMAQDFIAAFYPGRDNKGITTLEFDGVELAAIQGLNQKLEDRSQELAKENAGLKAQNDSLARQLNDLATEVKAIEQKR